MQRDNGPLMGSERSPVQAPLRMDRAGLELLINALRARGYQVIGAVLRDGAIVYGSIEKLADLPAGWTSEQDPGSYRLRRRCDQALFGFAAGLNSMKEFLHEFLVELASEAGSDLVAQLPVQTASTELTNRSRALTERARGAMVRDLDKDRAGGLLRENCAPVFSRIALIKGDSMTTASEAIGGRMRAWGPQRLRSEPASNGRVSRTSQSQAELGKWRSKIPLQRQCFLFRSFLFPRNPAGDCAF